MATFFNKYQSDRLLSPLTNNEYSIGQFAYPQDIGSEQFGHFIQFLIYETKTNNNPVEDRNQQRPVVNRDDPDVQQNLGPSQRQRPRREDPNATGIKGKRAAGTVGRTYRTSDIITLYMPENITATYGLDYEQVNIGALTMTGQGSSVGSKIDEITQFDSSSLSNLGQQIGADYKTLTQGLQGNDADNAQRQIGDIARVAASNANETLETALSANLREARNPHMEFLFRGVQQRTFTFEFTFTPKSEDEARRARDIIRLFKKSAMPEVRESSAGVFYQYPAEFDIFFMSNGKENEFLHKISTCALTNIDVNYTGAGMNSMHRETETGDGEVGAPPTHTQITLEFTELELMSAQRMEQGF